MRNADTKTTDITIKTVKKAELTEEELYRIKVERQKRKRLKTIENSLQNFYNINAMNIDLSKRVIFFTLSTRYAILNKKDMKNIMNGYYKILNYTIFKSKENKLKTSHVFEKHKNDYLHVHGFIYDASSYDYKLVQERTNKMIDKYCLKHNISLKPTVLKGESTNNVFIINDFIDTTNKKRLDQLKNYISKQFKDEKSKLINDYSNKLKEMNNIQFFHYSKEAKNVSKNYKFLLYLHEEQKKDFLTKLNKFLNCTQYKKEIRKVFINNKEYENIYNKIYADIEKKDVEKLIDILSVFTIITAQNLSKTALLRNKDKFDFNYKKLYKQIKDYNQCINFNSFLANEGLIDEEFFELTQ